MFGAYFDMWRLVFSFRSFLSLICVLTETPEREAKRCRQHALNFVSLRLVPILVIGLAACGGGGGGSSGGTSAPVAAQLSIGVVTPSSTSAVLNGSPITFTATCSGGTPPYNYQWQFGDGSLLQTNSGVATHTFTVAGTDVVVLTCADATGQTAAAPNNISISVVVPVPTIGNLTYTPSTPMSAGPIDFTANCNSPSAAMLNYLWDFGDGSTNVTTPSGAASHTYVSGGRYKVSVVCIDVANGVRSGTTTSTVAVSVPAPSVSVALAVSGMANVDWPTSLTVTCTGIGGGAWSYVWSFGDGSPNQTTTTGATSHRYSATGTYAVQVTCDDGSGTPASSTIGIVVGGTAPTLALLAGQPGGSGYADLPGALARFSNPLGVASDPSGNLYVADCVNDAIRKITAGGDVSTLAGFGMQVGSSDGIGGAANFFCPSGIAIDGSGNLYIADTMNHTIRRITSAGTVTTLAGRAGVAGSSDGPGSTATFNRPWGVAIDGSGSVYVADSGNQTIRKITSAGVVSTVAGAVGVVGTADGIGAMARFNTPLGIATDTIGNVFVADSSNHTIRKITAMGEVMTLAGTAGLSGSVDGTGTGASFNLPYGVATDTAGYIYVADTNNSTIRQVSPWGAVTTLAGAVMNSGHSDGVGSVARFAVPAGIGTDASGNVYVSETWNHTIRKIAPGGAVSTLAGTAPNPGNSDGTGVSARFYSPFGIATDALGNVYVADLFNNQIRKVTASGNVTTLSGTGASGYADGPGIAANFRGPTGVAVDAAGNVYVADSLNNIIRKVSPAGNTTTFAGTAGIVGFADGIGAAASFRRPTAITIDVAGNVYVADTDNSAVRKITPTGAVTTLSGGATFSQPQGLTTDLAGNVYVADTFSNTIRKITPAGMVTIVAGTPGSGGYLDGLANQAKFYWPQSLACDKAGNLYVTDNGAIRMVSTAGLVSTVAGTVGQRGFSPGQTPGILNGPSGVAVYGSTLYISNYGENSVVVVGGLP